MALLPAKCPECGGLIEVESENKAANCKYCNSAFIVEEAVNNFNTYFNITYNLNTTHNYGKGAVVNIFEDKSKDFVIEGGVLKKYQGASVDVVIPDGVVELGYGCFASLKINSVVIPDSVTNIGKNAFFNCTNLISIEFPKYLKSIGCQAFASCTNLSSIKIPDSVQVIDEEAFVSCTSLKTVVLPNNSIKVDYRAFCDTPYYNEKLIYKRKSNGLCQHCGGSFIGLFSLKCINCGKPKDY